MERLKQRMVRDVEILTLLYVKGQDDTGGKYGKGDRDKEEVRMTAALRFMPF